MTARRLALLAALFTPACVATNPKWDGPTGETVARDSETGSESSTSAADGTAEGGECREDERLCHGECRNVDDDPLACGVGCVDCTQWFGEDARCDHGQCRADGNSGEG